MPALVIKFNPLTYYNNNSTKETYPNLHCYINLNNNSSFFFLNSCYHIQNQYVPELVKVKPLTFIITFPLKKNIHLHCYMKHMLPFISKILFSASLCVRSQDWCCNLNPAISPSRVEIVCSSSYLSCSGTTVTSV